MKKTKKYLIKKKDYINASNKFFNFAKNKCKNNSELLELEMIRWGVFGKYYEEK